MEIHSKNKKPQEILQNFNKNHPKQNHLLNENNKSYNHQPPLTSHTTTITASIYA